MLLLLLQLLLLLLLLGPLAVWGLDADPYVLDALAASVLAAIPDLPIPHILC